MNYIFMNHAYMVGYDGMDFRLSILQVGFRLFTLYLQC